MTDLENTLAAVLSVAAVAGCSLTWIANAYRTAVLDRLRNRDGSPSIDEYVTRDMLAVSQTCAKLCRRIYSRVEDLADVMPAQLRGVRGCEVLTSTDNATVCCLLHWDDSVVVVWRGTQITNRTQVRSNAAVELVDDNIGAVHRGVLRRYLPIGWKLVDLLQPHVEAGRKIYVTGHSQGAALATLTVARLRYRSMIDNDPRWRPSGLITFGSPRVGDETFSDYVNCAVDYKPARGGFGVQRFRNNNDVVTLVPFRRRGYRHVGDCLYIWPSGVVTRSPCWILRAIQQAKAIVSDHVFGDALLDHSIDDYERRLLAIRIPEVRA